jgi:hypothetical protein
MKSRKSVNAVVLAVLICGLSANVAVANEPNGLTRPSVVAGVSAIEDSIYYPIVRQNAVYHPEALVRVAAWQVLRSDEGEPALRAFVLTGFAEARQRAGQNNERNRDFAQRVANTYTAAFSPRVNAAAQRALRGTDTDREYFARTGFAEAKALDEAAREADDQHKQQILDADRAFVRLLAESDPGEQVRLAAQYALRNGGTDADLRSFFASEWMAAAAVDLDVSRMRTQEAGVRLYAVIPQLIADAQDAEREALAASGAAAEQARAVAARAWATTKEKADLARAAWEDEAAACAEQARYWRTIIEQATGNADPVWAAIATAASRNNGNWTTEGAFAGDQTRYWAEVENQAQDGYDRMAAPA